MLLRLLLTYWGRSLFILKVVMLLNKNLIQQDTKNFRITNRPRRVFFLIIQKILKHPSQVYRIIHLLPSNPPSILVTKVSLHQMALIHMYYQASLLHQLYHGSLVFGIDVNSKKRITSNDTRLTITISDLIISEGLPFNLAQETRFKKVLELSRNVSKTCIPPLRNLIPKELLDVIHEQNMKSNLAIIKKEAGIFGLLFLGYGATISRFPFRIYWLLQKKYQLLFWKQLIFRFI